MISDINYEITQFYNLLLENGYDEDDADLIADDLAIDIKLTVDTVLNEFARLISYTEVDFSKIAKNIYDKYDIQKFFRESPFPMFRELDDVDYGSAPEEEIEESEEEEDTTPFRPESSFDLQSGFDRQFKSKRGRRRREIEANFISKVKEGAKNVVSYIKPDAYVSEDRITRDIENYLGDSLINLIAVYNREYLD